MTIDSIRKTYIVTSPGLWSLRGDLEILLAANIRFDGFGGAIDGFIGWGRRPSGLRAEYRAKKHSKEMILLEDGFLKSYAPGRSQPAHSFIIDRAGMFFDVTRPNGLADLLGHAESHPDRLARAHDVMEFIRENRISKYNNSPMIGLNQAGIGVGKRFVLLIDQVEGDASIGGALANGASFSAMLVHAAQNNPGASLVVRTHPAAGTKSLIRQAAMQLNIPIMVPARMNPWPLIEEAEAIYTVSSQLGFEALMAGRKVHCFGATYFSHRGLTQDHVELGHRHPDISIEALFHAAYIDYSRYLDLHDRSEVSIETALEQISTMRDHRNQIIRPVFTGGLSPWKRKALTPFTQGPFGPPTHCLTLRGAVNRAKDASGAVALWGSSKPLPGNVPAIRFEDGFLRSQGLGVNLTLPCSLAIDGDHPYYDARGISRLEQILMEHEFPSALIKRSQKLIETIVASGLSKYNVGATTRLPDDQPGRLKILVPGQVEKDASIRFGSPFVKTNSDLVERVRALFPDAFIAYKEHPDVTSGLRSGGDRPDCADIIVTQGDIHQWIGWCDRIETMTSLTGFEALLRGRPVGVHGMPFYAGWGLTEDRTQINRRGRTLTIAMLAAAALIIYPLYIHPISGLPCRVEDLVRAIATNRQVKTSRLDRLRLWLARSINRAAVRIRDSRL